MPEQSARLESLLQRCPEDIKALEELYRLLQRKVFAFAYSILDDPGLSEDCVQETFIRLPKAAARYTGKQAGLTFILAIAKNAAREIKRSRNRFPMAGEDFGQLGGSDFTEAVVLRDLLDGLNPKQRQIVVLHHYSGLTFEEIARLLTAPVSTIKSRYQRALTLLREAENPKPVRERKISYGTLGE